jgi:hypothetical protein
VSVRGPGWPAASRPKKITAQFDSVCPECEEEIVEGDTIWWSEYHDMYVCDLCGRA